MKHLQVFWSVSHDEDAFSDGSFLLDDGQWIASRHPHINIEDGFSIVSLLRARVPGDKRKAQPEKIWRENHHLISLLYFGL